MTIDSGQRVTFTKRDLLKVFCTVMTATALPIGGAMLVTWKDVAVVKSQVQSLETRTERIEQVLLTERRERIRSETP